MSIYTNVIFKALLLAMCRRVRGVAALSIRVSLILNGSSQYYLYVPTCRKNLFIPSERWREFREDGKEKEEEMPEKQAIASI